MRAATYSRVSTDRDQKPEIQVEELRRYCLARGWEVSEELVDRGYSGGNDNRPGLKQLMALVRSRKVDVVIVLKLDRLFRSLKHLVATLDEFQALGVQFVAVKDSVDYTTPAGRLIAQILGSLAEFEKSLIRERTVMGLQYARSKGRILGRPKKRDDCSIRTLRASGLSYGQIQTQLRVSKGAVCRALTTPKTPSMLQANSPIKSGGECE